MKSSFRFLMILVSTLGTSSAFADFVCSNMAADYGYSVTFPNTGPDAQVRENSIAGARIIADLKCHETGLGNGYDGFIEIVCTETNATPGYTATIRAGGLAGLPRAVLRHGDIKIATLKCNDE